MGNFEKYMFAFEDWHVGLLEPFANEFYTNPREREIFVREIKKVKFIEFVRPDGTLISFQFGMSYSPDFNIWFSLSTFLDGLSYTRGCNEYYLHEHTQRLKKMEMELTKVSEAIYQKLYTLISTDKNERMRYVSGIKILEEYPGNLTDDVDRIINVTPEELIKIKKRINKEYYNK